MQERDTIICKNVLHHFIAEQKAGLAAIQSKYVAVPSNVTDVQERKVKVAGGS
jgi:hypothetical protein